MTSPDVQSIAAAIAPLAGFALEDGALRVRYRFADFRAAFAFMRAVAKDAEELQHHPDWSNSYNKVEIALRTHDQGAVTQKDLDLAAAIDQHARRYVGKPS